LTAFSPDDQTETAFVTNTAILILISYAYIIRWSIMYFWIWASSTVK